MQKCKLEVLVRVGFPVHINLLLILNICLLINIHGNTELLVQVIDTPLNREVGAVFLIVID